MGTIFSCLKSGEVCFSCRMFFWNFQYLSIYSKNFLCISGGRQVAVDQFRSDLEGCFSLRTERDVRDQCLPAMSCQGQCGQGLMTSPGAVTPRLCACDFRCHVYQDCCQDFTDVCTQEQLKYTESDLSRLVGVDRRCVAGYLVISGCPTTRPEAGVKPSLAGDGHSNPAGFPGRGKLIKKKNLKTRQFGLSNRIRLDRLNKGNFLKKDTTDGIGSDGSSPNEKVRNKFENQRYKSKQQRNATKLPKHKPDRFSITDMVAVTDTRQGISYINLSIYDCNSIGVPDRKNLRFWNKRYLSPRRLTASEISSYLTGEDKARDFHAAITDAPPIGLDARPCLPKPAEFWCKDLCSKEFIVDFEIACRSIVSENVKFYRPTTTEMFETTGTTDMLKKDFRVVPCTVNYKIESKSLKDFELLFDISSKTATIISKDVIEGGWNEMYCLPNSTDTKCELEFSCTNKYYYDQEDKRCRLVTSMMVILEFQAPLNKTNALQLSQNIRKKIIKHIESQKRLFNNKCGDGKCTSYIYMPSPELRGLSGMTYLQILRDVIRQAGSDVTARVCYDFGSVMNIKQIKLWTVMSRLSTCENVTTPVNTTQVRAGVARVARQRWSVALGIAVVGKICLFPIL